MTPKHVEEVRKMGAAERMPQMLGNVFSHLPDPTDVYYFSDVVTNLDAADQCLVPDRTHLYTVLIDFSKFSAKVDKLITHQPNE